MPKNKKLKIGGRTKLSVDVLQNKAIGKLTKQVAEIRGEREKKFLDTSIFENITTTTNTTVINNILPVNLDGSVASASASLSQRKGKRITQKTILIRGRVFNSSSSGNPDDWTTMRMLVVRFPDSLVNSGTPMTNVLRTATSGSTILFSHKEPQPKNHYDILYDRTFNLQAYYQSDPQQTPTDKWRHNLNLSIKLKGDAQSVRWGDTESVSSPNNNGIAVMLISDSSAISHPVADLNVRLKYEDF